jgi:hypothetical protein
MLGVTLFGLLFTPVFYVLVRRVALLWTPHAATLRAGVGPGPVEVEHPPG